MDIWNEVEEKLDEMGEKFPDDWARMFIDFEKDRETVKCSSKCGIARRIKNLITKVKRS